MTHACVKATIGAVGSSALLGAVGGLSPPRVPSPACGSVQPDAALQPTTARRENAPVGGLPRALARDDRAPPACSPPPRALPGDGMGTPTGRPVWRPPRP